MPIIRTNVRYFAPRRGLAAYVAAVRGMGQCVDPESGESVDCGGGISMPPVDQVPLPGTTDFGTSTTGLPGGSALPGATVAPPTVTTSPGGSTNPLASILQSLAGGALVGSQIYKSTQSPSLIPGTNAIYNPATGQYYNSVTGQVVSPNSLPTGSVISSSAIPIILIAALGIGGIMLIEGMHH